MVKHNGSAPASLGRWNCRGTFPLCRRPIDATGNAPWHLVGSEHWNGPLSRDQSPLKPARPGPEVLQSTNRHPA